MPLAHVHLNGVQVLIKTQHLVGRLLLKVNANAKDSGWSLSPGVIEGQQPRKLLLKVHATGQVCILEGQPHHIIDTEEDVIDEYDPVCLEAALLLLLAQAGHPCRQVQALLKACSKPGLSLQAVMRLNGSRFPAGKCEEMARLRHIRCTSQQGAHSAEW